MAPASCSGVHAITIILLLIHLQMAEAFRVSNQCTFRGYKPGGLLPGIKKISAVPPEKFEKTVLDNVFNYFNKGGTATAATLAVIDSAGGALKGSPQVTAALGIIAMGIGFASDSPSPNDILDKAFKSVELLAEEMNERINQLQDYTDVKISQFQKQLMINTFKELFQKWSNCAKDIPGEDPDVCQKNVEKYISDKRVHFQALNSIFDQKINGKRKYTPHFDYRIGAGTWQWMKKQEAKQDTTFFFVSHDDVKRLEASLIPFRDYATLHLLALQALASSYKDKVGEEACKIYKHTLTVIAQKSDYYVSYARWAYEWIYIRQYEENLFLGLTGRFEGRPATAFRGGFLGTIQCSGSKCTIECSQMMKDNMCTVNESRRKKRSWRISEKANSLCDDYLGKLKQELTKFWTESLLDVAKRWEMYGQEAKSKLTTFKCAKAVISKLVISKCSKEVIAPRDRSDCGWPGITKEQCLKTQGCCFDSSVRGVKWCFKGTDDRCSKQVIAPKARVECGWAGISRRDCEKRKECCFDNSVQGVKWCFRGKDG